MTSKILINKFIPFAFLIFVFISAEEARATHMMGAEITYRGLDTLKYEVTVKFYRDCRGIPLSIRPADFTISCSNGGAPRSVVLTRQSIREITRLSKGTTAQCSPQNQRANEGIEEHVYTAILDFNTAPLNSLKNCSGKIILETGQCCRNGAINTGVIGDFTVAAEIDLNNAPINSSPQFGLSPFAFLCCNQPVRLSASSIQTDGDSLSVSWDEPFGGNINQKLQYSGTNYAYNHPFQAFYPGGSKPPFSNKNANPPIGIYLNKSTGDVVFTPTRCDEVTVAKLRITEWRKDTAGVYREIGYISRDMQYNTDNCPDNNPPYFSSILKDTFEISGCIQNFNFMVEVKDKQYIPSPPTAPSAPDTVSYIIPMNWPAGIGYTILDSDSLHPRLEIHISNLYLQSQNYRQHTLNLPLEIKDNNSPMNAVAQSTIQIFFSKDPNSSISQIRGAIIDDSNKNCEFDSNEDSVSIRRQLIVQDSSQSFSVYAEPDGSFAFCIKPDSLTIGLAPSPWFDDQCADSSIVAKADSAYELTLFSQLKDGVYGYVYQDLDTSCSKTGSSLPIRGQLFALEPGNRYVTTDADGLFMFTDLANGNYTLKPILGNNSSHTSICKDSVSFTYSGGSLKLADFFLTKTNSVDPFVSINSNYIPSLFRGRKQTTTFPIFGLNEVDSLTLYAQTPNGITLTSSDTNWQDLGNGRHSYYYVNNGYIPSFTIGLFTDPSVYSRNDTATLTYYIDTLAKDSNRSNNRIEVKYVIRAPYDPNIKITEQDSIFTVDDRYLDYIIYFQNTGDAPAARVVVRDTLPDELDISKIQFLGASHDYYPLMDNRRIWFVFDDIYLPDSTEDSDGSIGYVTFRVPIYDSIYENTYVRNKASIYFDFEDPIVTPTKINHFKSPTELTPSKSVYCPYDSLKVDFVANFSPESDNVYYLEMTDSSGDYATFSVVDSLISSDASGSLAFDLNESFETSENYWLRIRTSNDPSTSFTDEYKQIEITENIIPQLSTSAEGTICFGDSVTIEVLPLGAAVTWWLNGNSVASTNEFSSTTLGDGDQLYAVVSEGGCDFISDTLTLSVGNTPQISLELDSIKCSDQSNVVIAPSIILLGSGEDDISTVRYDFGDGTIVSGDSAEPKTHSYNFGKYSVVISAATDFGCADTFGIDFTLAPPSQANFTVNDVCLGDSVVLRNSSNTPTANIEYRLGDGNIITNAPDSTPHLYTRAFSYNITQITNLGLCSDTLVKTVSVRPNPMASFSATKSDTNAAVVEIINTTIGADTYLWNFGDGNSSTNKNTDFTYQYDSTGKYIISLLAETTDGCSDSTSQEFEAKLVSIKQLNASNSIFIIPSLYSPDGDGLNDSYIIRPLEEIQEIDFKVYSMYGQLFNQSNDKNRLIKTSLGQGMYVYTVEIVDLQGNTYNLSGKLEVVR